MGLRRDSIAVPKSPSLRLIELNQSRFLIDWLTRVDRLVGLVVSCQEVPIIWLPRLP